MRALFDILRNLWNRWCLEGWDTFGRHSYPIEGSYWSESAAQRAAQRELQRIEQLQPSSQSGGQDGIQDHVFIISPAGEKRRVLPPPSLSDKLND